MQRCECTAGVGKEATASIENGWGVTYTPSEVGGSSIYESSLLQRCFRNVHTVTQHIAVAPDNLEDVGRVVFGLEPKSPLF